MVTTERVVSSEQRRKNALKAISQYWPVGWRPEVKQWKALTCTAPELLYGGQAGGMKSETLLARALMYGFHPDSHSLILRKTRQDLTLPDALLDRGKRWLLGRKGVHYNGMEYKFTLPSGSTITFSYLQNVDDHLRYDGGAYTFVGIDEARQIPEYQLRYMNRALRQSIHSPVPMQLMLATNPGGVSNDYLFERFVNPDTRAPGCEFIPASLEENPHLPREDYERRLMQLDPIERARLMHGDWEIRTSGGMFDSKKFIGVEINDIPEFFKGAPRVRFWDMAATEVQDDNHKSKDPDYTVGVKMAYANGYYLIEDVKRFRKSPAGVEQEISETTERDRKGEHLMAFCMEEEGGSSGKAAIHNYARGVFSGTNFKGIRSTGSKPVRAQAYSAAVENKLVYILKGQEWTKDFKDEHHAFPNKYVHDDQVDAAAGAFNELVEYRRSAGLMIYKDGKYQVVGG